MKWKQKKMNTMDIGTDMVRGEANGEAMQNQEWKNTIQECHFSSGQLKKEVQSMETDSYESTV